MSSDGRRIVFNAIFIVAGVIAVAEFGAGCTVKLPEEGTPQARLYRQRCSECHDLVRPQSMTPKMWEVILGRLDGTSRRGHPEVPVEERAPLLDYVMRNALRPGKPG